MPKRLDVGVGVLLGVATILLFRDSLTAMRALWDVSPMYSYGYTVPPISAFLLWWRRDELMGQPVTPSRLWGGAAMLASLSILAIGQIAAVQVIQQLAFIGLIAGVVLYLFGRVHLQIAAPAIAYLLFMVPMWDAFTEPLHWPFQNNSAQLGVAIIQRLGIPVHREATLITLPNVVMEVARECSGVNYLIAVLALAVPLSLLRLRQAWRRVALITASLVVAALSNGLRVALIGVLAYLEIGSPLHGPLHMLHGLFVAAIGYVVLFVGLRLLQEPDEEVPSKSVAPVLPTGSWRRGEATGLAALLLALVFVGGIPQTHEIVLAQPLEALPQQLGTWSAMPPSPGDARAVSFTAVWSNADQRLTRRYSSPSGTTAIVEVYYYAAQRQGREAISSASSPLHQHSTQLTIQGAHNRAFTANAIDWAATAETALFWYDLDGLAQAGELPAKLSTMWRAIRFGRTNAAVVVIRTSAAPAARAALTELAGTLQSALTDLFMPGGD